MPYINSVEIGNNNYLIEPTLYIAPSLENTLYSASLNNFEPVAGVAIQAYFNTSNPAQAQLQINTTTAAIYYMGQPIIANALQAGHTYTLVYTVSNEVGIWNVLGDLAQTILESDNIGVLPINHGGTGTGILPTNSLLFATTTTNEGVSTQTLQSTHYINTITEDNNTYSVLGVNTNSVDTGYRLKVNGDSKFLGKVDIVTQNGNNQVTIYGNQYTPIYWNEGIPTPTALVRKINFTIAASKYGVVIQDSLFDSNSIVTQIVVTSGIEYINSPLNWSYYNNNNVSGICIELESGSSLAANTSISGYILVSQGETSGSMITIDLPINEPEPETPSEDNNSNT